MRIWVAAAVCAALATCAAKQPRCPSPTIRIGGAISAEDSRHFEAQLRDAIAAVCAWWGPSYTGPYNVTVESAPGPSMAMVPAWKGNRGSMIFRVRLIRSGRSPIRHEVTHMFAPNGNRFLAEGLATYAQEMLGGVAAYPNFGKDLHRQAAQYAETVDLARLERFATPRPLRTGEGTMQRNYLVAGSFVRFLIESRGLPAFRRLYALTPMVPGKRNAGKVARWNRVYGKSFAELVREWRAAIAR